METSVRLDKWLWAVRVFKTRADAAEGCRCNRVSVNGAYAKASREVRVGDVVAVRKGVVTFSHRVLALVSNRQPASNVSAFAEDVTPPEERVKLDIPRETVFISRDRGAGRPTKKERRDIDSLMDELLP